MKGEPVRIIPHSPKGIPDTGSFEVRFADGRASVYFYWDDNPGRRSISMSVQMDRSQALAAARTLARTERDQAASFRHSQKIVIGSCSFC